MDVICENIVLVKRRRAFANKLKQQRIPASIKKTPISAQWKSELEKAQSNEIKKWS